MTVGDNQTTATVTLATANVQPNTSYFPILTPSAFTGAPPLGATNIVSISKTTTQFTITVNASTGVGNTVTFNYYVCRNS